MNKNTAVPMARNKTGWTLLEYFNIDEKDLIGFQNITGAYAVIKVKEKYLIGYNKWRSQWEFPAGGIEYGETARQAAIRELYEETHQRITALDFRGLVKVKDAKGILKHQAVFSGELHELSPFLPDGKDEMEKIALWDGKQDIGYVDELDIAVVRLLE